MHNFIEQIIHKKTPCYFISPSIGDAASSCGELIDYLTDQQIDVTVVNIFTQPGDSPYTLSGKKFLKNSSVTNTKEFYEQAKAEDEQALALFPVKIVNMDLADALWRKKEKNTGFGSIIPEFDNLYPTYRHIMSGNITKEDEKLKETLKAKLQSLIKEKNQLKIFCPIGVLRHIDYLLIRDICWELFEKDCIFYTPPVTDTGKEKKDFIKQNSLEQCVFTTSSAKKAKVLKLYKSQQEQFFAPNSLVFTPEIYYQQLPKEKKAYEIIIHNELTDTIEKAWQQLWEKSSLKNFCNGPLWFKAATKTFSYPQQRILLCYDEKKLIAVLPVVLTEKYGVPVYATPGNQYYDTSSLLLSDYNYQVVRALLTKLQEVGSFYLAELTQPITNMIQTYMPTVGSMQLSASSSPYLYPQSDPHRLITKKNKGILRKNFRDGGDDFSYEYHTTNAGKYLDILLKIDQDSSKKITLKDTFGDITFKKLLENIDTIHERTIFIALLLYKGEPICYNFGVIYDKAYMGLGTAYKIKVAHFSPGRLLVYKLFADLMAQGITYYDFSRGVSRFKKDFTMYFSHQYAAFYTKSPAIRLRWQLLEGIKNNLGAHPALFEFVRKTKRTIVH